MKNTSRPRFMPRRLDNNVSFAAVRASFEDSNRLPHAFFLAIFRCHNVGGLLGLRLRRKSCSRFSLHNSPLGVSNLSRRSHRSPDRIFTNRRSGTSAKLPQNRHFHSRRKYCQLFVFLSCHECFSGLVLATLEICGGAPPFCRMRVVPFPCLSFRSGHRVRRAKLRVISLRSGSFFSQTLVDLLRVE